MDGVISLAATCCRPCRGLIGVERSDRRRPTDADGRDAGVSRHHSSLVVVQFFRATRSDLRLSKTARVSPRGVDLRTAYPGLVMIGFGTVLLLAGRIIG
jgi:hypothetical protein